MADQKLTSKSSLSAFDDADLIHVVDVSDTTSSPQGTSKKGLWSLIKSTLKTYFDTLYLVVGKGITDNATTTALTVTDSVNGQVQVSSTTDHVAIEIETTAASKTAQFRISNTVGYWDFTNDTNNSLLIGANSTYFPFIIGNTTPTSAIRTNASGVGILKAPTTAFDVLGNILASGTIIGSNVLSTNIDDQRQALMIPEPSGFSYVPFNVVKNDDGVKIDNDDWETMFRTKYSGFIGSGTSYVSPEWGDDTNAGTLSAPYATINKAIDAAPSTIYLFDGVYDFIDFRDTDTQGNKARIIIGLGNNVVMKQTGDDISSATFLISGGTATLNTTLTNGDDINRLLRNDILDDDGNPTPIPEQASAALVNSSGYGWHYDTGTKVLTVRIANTVGATTGDRETWWATNIQPILEVSYIGTTATNQRIFIQNTKTFFKNITINGGYFYALKTSATAASVKPVIWLENVNMYYPYNGNLFDGGEFFIKDTYVTRANGDNAGYHVSDGVEAEAVEYNFRSTYAGDVDTFPSTTANKNASSMHENGTILRINGEYENAYPYNIVDTGTAGTSTGGSWNVGCKSKNASSLDIVMYDRTVYLDHVEALTIQAADDSTINYNDLVVETLDTLSNGVLTEYEF
tara:strand:+ start:472 stop:2364 length:1893 start_codon:yes stop_codon:yes gene_type:complete